MVNLFEFLIVVEPRYMGTGIKGIPDITVKIFSSNGTIAL